MRRLLLKSITSAAAAASQCRSIIAGPTTTGADANRTANSHMSPSEATSAASDAFASVSDFGSVKRREQRRKEREIRNKATMDALDFMQRVIARPSPTEELDAQSQLRDMGFTSKPPSCVYHRQFLSELRRYRLDLGVSPQYHNTIQTFNLVDYGLDGKGDEVTLCENLRSSGDGDENLISELHQAISNVVFSTDPTTYKVKIANEFLIGHELVFKSVFPLGTSESTSSSSADMSAEDRAAAEAERLLNESLRQPFDPIPGGPYRRYLQRVDLSIVNLQSGQRKELFTNMSVQAVTYLFIMAISRFLKTTKAQKNNPFGNEDVGYLRYCIVNLRQQIGMEAIGNFELDTLLPKPQEE